MISRYTILMISNLSNAKYTLSISRAKEKKNNGDDFHAFSLKSRYVITPQNIIMSVKCNNNYRKIYYGRKM